MSSQFVKTENGTVIIKDKNKPFRILQLTDIHIGGSIITKKLDKLALEAVRKVVTASNADLVVITGDLVYPIPIQGGTMNNLKSAKMIGGLMDELDVPWTFVYGNHDSESFAKADKHDLAAYYSSLHKCYFEEGPKDITGVGNYCIPIKNEDGKIINALMFIDSNAYLTKSFHSGFDIIHQDQVDWYKETILNLSEGKEIVPSFAFFHIPPKEMFDAWRLCYTGSKDVKYFLGFNQEKDNYVGYPKQTEGVFFKQMVDFGSCKGMFFGHDHLNTMSLEYQGIRLTYGMSIDYFAYPGIIWKHTQRGGTLIDIEEDGSFEISVLPLNSIE